MKVLVTGSTGLVGTALVQELQRAGHAVCRLIRPETSLAPHEGSPNLDVNWNPATGELGGAAAGADAVVNLAGAPIAGGRWTLERKRLLRSSRVDTTRSLVKVLARMGTRPRVLVSASAIGYYGSRGDDVLNEGSGPGNDFLSEVAQGWELEAMKAESLGIRVVCTRFGVILAKHGGAMPKMIVPFRLGVGGRMGSGKQWMSWVMLQEAVAIVQFVLENESVRGPVNVVSPQPVRNEEFTRVLAKALHRPALFPAPAFALRLAVGEMAEALLLASHRVQPIVVERLGYRFLHPELEAGVRALLA